MKRKFKSFLYHFLAPKLGNLLILAFPEKARKMSENRITLIHKNKKNMTVTEILMRIALIKKLEAIEDHDTIRDKNRNFWINNSAVELFNETEDGFKKDFLPNCTFIFKLLKEQLSKTENEFLTIVEIGTGNGDVLNWLSSEFPNVQKLIGLDLSEHQIQMNREKFNTNKKLEFIAADAYDWIPDHCTSNTLFVSSRGVLEYFLEPRLQQLLKNISQLGAIYFVAIEPNGGDHDFEKKPNSQLYGNEPSFSHNYPLLFKNAGFEVWHFSQQPWLGGFTKQTFIGARC